MATFEAQVAGLTSLTIDDSSSPTRAELNQFLTDGAKEIINIMPLHLLSLCASQSTFTSTAAGSESETLNTAKILNVFRNDGDIDQPCREVNSSMKGRVSDPNEMQYASITDPVYYIENNKINSLPDGGSCKYSEVQYPTVSYTHEDISVFPDEAEYLVPLYASIKSLQNALGNKTSSLPSDITFPSIPTPPSSPSFNSGAITITSSVPTYVKPAFAAPVLGTIGDLVLPPTPTPPTLSAKSVTITGTAPTYVSQSYGGVEKYIDGEEDVELAQSKLQEINSQIQDSLNKFNDANVEYQAKLQKDVQDAQLSDANEARKLQKYQSEVSSYQAEVNSKVQEWINEEWNQNFQKYQQDYSSKLQEYNSNLQNELNEFNKEQTVFQNELQEKVQEANNQQTKDSAEYSAKIQKYGNETQSYTSEVNQKVQDFNTKLQKHNTDYQWLQGQHKQLIDDYNRGVQILTGGEQPQRGQEYGRQSNR